MHQKVPRSHQVVFVWLCRNTCDKSCIHTVESTAGGFDPNHVWEECRTMSNPLSWGYNRNLRVDQYESSKQMIHHVRW